MEKVSEAAMMAGSPLQHSGFFVLHTPLLSFDELAEWSGELEAPGSRARLRLLLERPEVREALFLSSPALFEKIDGWLGDPESDEGRSVEQSLVRGILRMASFCPPSGAISGACVGSIGSRTTLQLRERGSWQRRVALDLYYLDALTEALAWEPALRRQLRYRRSSSLYRANGRLKYVEPRREPGPRIFRTYHLASVESSEALDGVLERAAEWTAFPDLVQALVASDPDGDLSVEEAEEFLDLLIDNHLLVSELSPALTEGDPLPALVDHLSQLGSRYTEPLAQVARDLEEVGGSALGVDPRRYLAMAHDLGPLPVTPELPRLIQADLIKSAAEASLGSAVLDEIEPALSILRCCSGHAPAVALAGLRQALVERFGEGCAVPLAEALDDEIGTGFRPSLEQREMPAALRAVLERKLDRALAEGGSGIELGEEDLAGIEERLPLPGAFSCVVSVAAPGRNVPGSAEPWIHLIGAFGSPGLGTPARLCHEDGELRTAFASHLRAEEKMDPEAIHAEIVHWPDGRPGNAALRPPLRSCEIPFLARSGAPEEAQIPIEDLRIMVEGDRILLFSARLGRRVLPRQAAEASPGLGLPLYELLLALQGQDAAPRLQWSWGSWTEGFPFLPRVVTGSVVLARAVWRMTGDEIASLWGESHDAARFQAVQSWCLRRKLPRWVVMVDGAKQLLVDFHNLLAIEAFLSMVRKYRVVHLEELFPTPDQLCVTGPEGRFLHEMVIPLLSVPARDSAKS